MRPLKQIFAGIVDDRLLVGLDSPDDAAVYRINAETAIILTTDFFTPIVDDPYDYGAIAAANAVSDVYAMGGDVALALNIAAFPADLPVNIVAEIFRGGAEKVREAGGIIAGGHTVDAPEPKYGLAVLGLIHPDRVATKGQARPGDLLVLTKPLGVGLVTTAFKADMAEARSLDEAVAWMSRLNRAAARAMTAGDCHTATDITGFSLLGHSCEIAERSRVRLRLRLEALPFVHGAKTLAEAWLFPGGTNKNEAAYRSQIEFEAGLPLEMQMLLFTPETSGGLLVAMPPGELDNFRSRCADLEQPVWVVGEVLAGTGVEVITTA
jgi:selenide,water dikinase